MKIPAVKFLSRWSTVALITATLPAAAGSVDTAKSQVSATFRQMNVPVEGHFKSFRGTISFDPKTVVAAYARIEIDTASFDVGTPDYNDELRMKEWFDTPNYPKAIFISRSVTLTGQNRFEATGKLTLKGKAQTIKVPFAHRTDDGIRTYEGEFPISRKYFSIGSADWDGTLEDKVIVKFRITAAAK